MEIHANEATAFAKKAFPKGRLARRARSWKLYFSAQKTTLGKFQPTVDSRWYLSRM